MKKIKDIENELNDKFYLDMQVCHITITPLSGYKVSLKLFKNKNDKKPLTSLSINNLFLKGFEAFLNLKKSKMESWMFSRVENKFLVDIDSEYCTFLNKEDIQKIVNGLTIQKRDILESRILTFDEFISVGFDNLGDFENQSSQELEDELLFDIHDEPINFYNKNLDRYDSKRDEFEEDYFDEDDEDCYFDCYDSDEDFESGIEDCYGLDFYDEIEEMASFTEHGLERIKERGISKSLIDKILDSCKMKLLKFRDEVGKKILIRSTKENVSVVGTLQKINSELKFKVITAIQGIGLKYDEDYNLIKI